MITSLLIANRSERACRITRTPRASSLLPSAAQGRCPQGGGAAASSGGRSCRKGVRTLRARPSGAFAPPPLRYAGEDFVIASILIANRGKSAGGIIRTTRASSLRPSAAQGRCPQGGGVAAASGGRSRRKGVRSLRARPSGAVAPPPLRYAGEDFVVASILIANRGKSAGGIIRTTRASSLRPSEAQGRCPQGRGVAASSGGRSRRKGVRSLRSRPSGAFAPPPLRFAGED